MFRPAQGRGGAQDKHIKTMLSLVVRMEKHLDDHREDYTLPEAASHDFKMAVHAFARLNTSLGQLFHNNGDMIFHVTVKHHYLLHCALQAKHLNPRITWCYGGGKYDAKSQDVGARESSRSRRASDFRQGDEQVYHSARLADVGQVVAPVRHLWPREKGVPVHPDVRFHPGAFIDLGLGVWTDSS